MVESSIYEYCSSVFSDAGLMECIADSLETGQLTNANDVNSFFLIYAAALVFFMQAGFAMLCAGSVRMKNVQNTMLKNLLDACGAALAFFAVGYAFSFGGQDNVEGTTFIGHSNFFLMNVQDYAFWLFQFAFASTAATIVAGTLAERCQMVAYLCYSICLTGFVYPVIAHAVWSNNGWLSPFNANPLWETGMIDFSGSGVVHVTGGTTALIATYVLGPRKGRFYDNRGNPLDKPKDIVGHSVALQMLGTFILWFGWYGFNPGSALFLENNQGDVASLCAVTTTLAAAAGSVTALFTQVWISERTSGEAKFELSKAMNGALSGLVSITSGCAVVEPWASVVIGFIAGGCYLIGSHVLIKLRLDDAVDAIPVHFFNGLWGVVATGLFANPTRLLNAYGRDKHCGWFYSWGRSSADATLLGTQLVGLLFIAGWVLVLMFPFFLALNYMGWFRADSLEEMVGLDISYHGRSAIDNDDGGATYEYVEAFRKRQEGLRRRKSRRGSPRFRREQPTIEEAAEATTEGMIDNTEEEEDDDSEVVEA